MRLSDDEYWRLRLQSKEIGQDCCRLMYWADTKAKWEAGLRRLSEKYPQFKNEFLQAKREWKKG